MRHVSQIFGGSRRIAGVIAVPRFRLCAQAQPMMHHHGDMHRHDA